MGNLLSTPLNIKYQKSKIKKLYPIFKRIGTKIGIFLLTVAAISWNMPKIWQIIFILWSIIAITNYELRITNYEALKSKFEEQRTLSVRAQSLMFKCLISSAVILLIISAQIIPLLKNKIISTGFDTGYYRHYLAFKDALPKNIPHYILDKSWLVQKILDIFRFLKFPADISLFVIPIFFSILTAFGIYLIGKEMYSKKAGFIGAFLFAASPVQFLAFDYMLIKNTIGICLFVFLIHFFTQTFGQFQKKEKLEIRNWKLENFNLFFIFTFGILLSITLTHRTTSFIAIAVLSISLFIILIKNWREVKKYLIWIISAFLLISGLAIFWNFPTLKMLAFEITNGFKNMDPLVIREGMFIDPERYLLLAIPILPFAILGFFEKIKEREFDIIFTFASFCVLWILFQLIFYKRVIIFLDLALILLVSPPLGGGVRGGEHSQFSLTNFIIAILLASTAFISIRTACADTSSISKSELANIQQLAELPQGTILAISSAQSPWIYGLTPHNITAPGLFGNTWPHEVWDRFWNEDNPVWFQSKKELLAPFVEDRKPLYIFTGENVSLPALPEECLEEINGMSWMWKCIPPPLGGGSQEGVRLPK